MSVDVEEWYHGEFTRRTLSSRPLTKVEQSVAEIIELFEVYGTEATFFVVGDTLLRYPRIGNLILDAGHELAYHGWDHRPLWELHPNDFAHGLRRYQELLDEWDYTPIGFRAPSASLNNQTAWALKELIDVGYLYDSSVFPCWTPLYGVPRAPIFPYWPSAKGVGLPSSHSESYKIPEFPFLALGPGLFRIPLGTGFYLRTLPMFFYRWALSRRSKQGIPGVVSFHSWEFSYDVPRIQTSILKRRYLYYGLHNCRPRVESLLSDYSFTSGEKVARKFRSQFPS